MQPSSKRIKEIYLCRDGRFVENPYECDEIEDYLDPQKRLSLSKLLSGLLRHYPWKAGISLDERGWVSIFKLLKGIRSLKGYEWVKEWHIRAIAFLDPKGRFELIGNKIRARYGHTIPVKVEPLPGKIPNTLYHGTPSKNLSSILKYGIKKMKRLKVHLASSPEVAVETGARRSKSVAVLEIDVKCLESLGYNVEKASDVIFTVEHVPPKCIKGYKIVKIDE